MVNSPGMTVAQSSASSIPSMLLPWLAVVLIAWIKDKNRWYKWDRLR